MTWGPWTKMSVGDGIKFIYAAMRTFKRKTGQWPQATSDATEPLLHGSAWSIANRWLRSRGSGILLLSNRAVDTPWSKMDLNDLEDVARCHGEAYKEAMGRYPSRRTQEPVGKTGFSWESLDNRLHKLGSSLRRVFGGTRHVAAEITALEVSTFCQTRGRVPLAGAGGSGDPEEIRLANALRYLQSRRQDLVLLHKLPPRGDRAESARQWQASRSLEERRASAAKSQLKISPETRFAAVKKRAAALTSEQRSAITRKAQDKHQWMDLSYLVPDLCTHWRLTTTSTDWEVASGKALDHALHNAARKDRRSKSRGLGATDLAVAVLCQVTSLACANDEVGAECWRFTLKGASSPDPRKWADILASGDNKKIESAERVAFLDWETPDKDAVTIVDTLGRPQPPATRRPWSPPATQSEAGKPAPAKGKGKRS